jgi:hypothetical protein
MSSNNVEAVSNEILESRKKFSEKFGNLKLGGKGTKSNFNYFNRNTKEKEDKHF